MKNGIRTFFCIGCGELTTKSCGKRQKYCSAGCYHKNRPYSKPKEGNYKICPICEKTFYVIKSRIDKATFCSTECANIYQGRNKVNLICKNCGKEFLRAPSFHLQKYCSIDCRNKDPDYIAFLVECNTKQSRSFPNNFEIMAYSILDELGIEYMPQYIVNNKFTVDAFVPSKNTIIQFDGDYWHGNPRKYSAIDKRVEKRMALDKSQDAYARKIGMNVVRLWQSDFDNREKIETILRSIWE